MDAVEEESLRIFSLLQYFVYPIDAGRHASRNGSRHTHHVALIVDLLHPGPHPRVKATARSKSASYHMPISNPYFVD